ncbi:MAG: HAD-IB family hydrolase [Actinomycetota bacterium]|nr:HAD-IB family hydrolase [Actinomycetota bacterium]
MSVAFFDLDNTLVKGSSMFYFARHLVKQGVFTKRELARFATAQARFIRTKTEDKKLQEIITEKALKLVAGRFQSEITQLCESALSDSLEEAIYPEILNCLKWHQERGQQTWILTASPIEIASGIAARLNMTGALGTVAEITDGRYTGKLKSGVLHGKNKAKALIQLADSMKIDLDNSYAYSDSLNDLPLLSAVGTPVVVNPNKELLRIARKNNWQEITTTFSFSRTA